jgi:hypothetical protein
MKVHQMSQSVTPVPETSLWQDLTEQEQEKLSGGSIASSLLRYFTAVQNYNWRYGGGQQKFINNVKNNGLGVIDRRVNAILSNLARFR